MRLGSDLLCLFGFGFAQSNDGPTKIEHWVFNITSLNSGNSGLSRDNLCFFGKQTDNGWLRISSVYQFVDCLFGGHVGPAELVVWAEIYTDAFIDAIHQRIFFISIIRK